MKYAQLRQYDIANGEGIRTSLFVSGCNFHCKNCFNQEYQNFEYGEEFSKEIQDTIIGYLKDDNVSGLSVLGGEPLEQSAILYNFLIRVKQEVSKTIWLWTGYVYEELNSEQHKLINDCIDVLIDGQFIEELRDLNLKFRGSSNQRIINIKQYNSTNKDIYKENFNI